MGLRHTVCPSSSITELFSTQDKILIILTTFNLAAQQTHLACFKNDDTWVPPKMSVSGPRVESGPGRLLVDQGIPLGSQSQDALP